MKAVIIFVVSLLISSSFAQSNTSKELLTQDLKKSKIEMLSNTIKFKDSTTAKKFWQIYNNYTEKNEKNNERYYKLLKDYSTHYYNMTTNDANSITKQFFELEEKRLKSLEKLYNDVKSKIDPITATRLIQFENRIDLFIDVQVVSTLPMLLPNGVGVGKAERVIEVTVDK